MALGHRQKLPQHLPAQESQGKAVVNRHFPLAEDRSGSLSRSQTKVSGKQAERLVQPLGKITPNRLASDLARKSQHLANRPQAQGFQALQDVWRQPQRRHGKAR